MPRATPYLVLAVVGAVIPYLFLARFFAAEGLPGQLIGAVFANAASTAFTSDLLLSSVVFWLFVIVEGARTRMSHRWVYVAVNLTVGLSCALPLFLWARERALGGDAGGGGDTRT